jgi:hypothetical protein
MKLKITVQSSLKKLVTKLRKRFNSSQSQDGTEITWLTNQTTWNGLKD